MKVPMHIFVIDLKVWVAAQDTDEAVANCFNATGIVGQAMKGQPRPVHDFNVDLADGEAMADGSN